MGEDPRGSPRRVDPSLPRSGNVRSYLTQVEGEISCISALSTNNVYPRWSSASPTTPGVQAIPRLVIACCRSPPSCLPSPSLLPSFCRANIYIYVARPPLTNCAKMPDAKFPLLHPRVHGSCSPDLAILVKFYLFNSSRFSVKGRKKGMD